MRTAALLWGSLFLCGVHCISGPGEVTIPYGETLTVTCHYDAGYQPYAKYWCKGEGWRSCVILIQTGGRNLEKKDKYSIVDNPELNTFTVTATKMKPEDSDIYWCGIVITGTDDMTEVKVTVLQGVCGETPRWSSMVTFPIGFRSVTENKVVEVMCREEYEKRTFLLTCRKSLDDFQFRPESDQAPCIRKCRRMIHWGRSITVDPEQEYYGRNEEVRLTCLEGYEATHSRIRCIRGHDTNSWDVSEVFCRKLYIPEVTTPVTLSVTFPGTSPLTPPINLDLDPASNSSWKVFVVSCTFGFIPLMAVKMVTILVIIAVRAFTLTKKKSEQDIMKMTRVSSQGKNNLYQVKEEKKSSFEKREKLQKPRKGRKSAPPFCEIYTIAETAPHQNDYTENAPPHDELYQNIETAPPHHGLYKKAETAPPDDEDYEAPIITPHPMVRQGGMFLGRQGGIPIE